MSSSTYSRPALLAASVALLAACTSNSSASSGPTSPAHSPSTSSTSAAPNALAQWPCLDGSGATRLDLPGTPALTAAVLGSSRRAVVFVDESDQDLCSWLAYAKTLTGYRVVLYDYVATPQGDLARVNAYLRANGASAVAFVGASQGAKAAIIAAVAARPQAVVSLSAETALQGTAVAPYAARLRAPALFVTAAADQYGAASATPGFEKVAPAEAKRLVVVAGTAHGTALLAQPAIARDVTQFLARYDR